MAIRTNRNDPWHGPSSSFQPNEGPARDSDQFAPLDLRGTGLRGFVEQELQSRAATSSSGTNTTLIPGKLYLRQQPCGLWELTHNRGRGTFDCYVGDTREEMLALAESLQEGGN